MDEIQLGANGGRRTSSNDLGELVSVGRMRGCAPGVARRLGAVAHRLSATARSGGCCVLALHVGLEAERGHGA